MHYSLHLHHQTYAPFSIFVCQPEIHHDVNPRCTRYGTLDLLPLFYTEK